MCYLIQFCRCYSIVPSPREQTINKWALELPRTRPHPEPTIDTMGVGAKSQGRHYNYIKLDDVYGDKARDSEAESATTMDQRNPSFLRRSF